MEKLDSTKRDNVEIQEQTAEIECIYCASKIKTYAKTMKHAKVCVLCGRDQRWWFNHVKFDHIGLIIALVLVILGYLQFKEARKDRLEALEALTRAKSAEEISQEATKAISEIKALAKILARTNLSLVMRTGRWGVAYSAEELEEIKESTLMRLQQLNLPKAEIEATLNDIGWHYFIELDYALLLSNNDNLRKYLNHEQIAELNKLWRNGNPPPSPQTIRSFLSSIGALSSDAEELIKDYDYYIKNHKHRRPEVWKKNQGWGDLIGKQMKR